MLIVWRQAGVFSMGGSGPLRSPLFTFISQKSDGGYQRRRGNNAKFIVSFYKVTQCHLTWHSLTVPSRQKLVVVILCRQWFLSKAGTS